MSQVNSFRDLEVWQLSIDLVERCYSLIKALPPGDRFIFGDQIIRAAVSIPANIAEGNRRPTRAYLNHLSIALGSEAELETHIEILRRLALASPGKISATDELARTVGRLLNGLKSSLERRNPDR
jgi:four helix bundle protein